MTAICTPTATREEFKSILRELEKSTMVKWCNGSLPTGEKYHDYGIVSHLIYSKSVGLSMTTYGDTTSKQLPRAEFISAIKRDFGRKTIQCCGNEDEERSGWYCEKCDTGEADISKMETTGEEQPKMNYNKMLKAELIKEIERLLDDERENSSELVMMEADLNEAEEQRDTARATADKYGKQCFDLEKANAEQAETIAELNTILEDSESLSKNWEKTALDAARLVKELREENTRIKRLASKVFADLLERN